MRTIRIKVDEHDLTICLYDNSAVTRWTDFVAKKISQHGQYQAICRTFFGSPAIGIDPTAEWQQILDAFQQLRDNGMNISLSLQPHWDGQQRTLNVLHRFFTDNLAWHVSLNHDPDSVNPYDESFVLPETLRSYHDWRSLVAKINIAVHRLENFSAPTENRQHITDQWPLKSWAFVIDIDQTHNSDIWYQFDPQDQQNNYSYFHDDRPLAILDWSIQGKSMLQSFADDDDPLADDCTGRLGSLGGFFVDIDNNRKMLYKSKQFSTWARSYGLDPGRLPLEFPIGWIEDLDAWKSAWKPGKRLIKSIQID